MSREQLRLNRHVVKSFEGFYKIIFKLLLDGCPFSLLFNFWALQAGANCREVLWITEPGVRYNSAVPISELPATVEVIESFREHFMCQRCGACCTVFDGVKVTENEMKGLGIPQTEWQDAFTKIEGLYYMKEPCRFYDSTRSGCTIYSNRPETCRNFPVHTIPCEDGLIHLSVSEICPAALDALAEVEVSFLGR